LRRSGEASQIKKKQAKIEKKKGKNFNSVPPKALLYRQPLHLHESEKAL
jgi:hypothetical protein